MPTLSETIAAQLQGLREVLGAEVVFDGAVYRVITQEVSARLAGSDALPAGALSLLRTSADPRVFVFSPIDFASATAPTEGNTLLWHGRIYVAAHVTWEDVDGGATQLLVYGYRRIVPPGDLSGLLPDEAIILRFSGASDGAGGETAGDYLPVAAVPCRLEPAERYTEPLEGEAVRGVTQWRARFEVGIDLRITDRVQIHDFEFEVIETDAGMTDPAFLTADLARVRG